MMKHTPGVHNQDALSSNARCVTGPFCLRVTALSANSGGLETFSSSMHVSWKMPADMFWCVCVCLCAQFTAS